MRGSEPYPPKFSSSQIKWRLELVKFGDTVNTSQFDFLKRAVVCNLGFQWRSLKWQYARKVFEIYGARYDHPDYSGGPQIWLGDQMWHDGRGYKFDEEAEALVHTAKYEEVFKFPVVKIMGCKKYDRAKEGN